MSKIKKLKANKTYHLQVKTINSIDEIEEKTGLKKSTIVDKAIEYYKSIFNNQ